MTLHLNFKEELQDDFLKLSCYFVHQEVMKEIWFKVPLRYASMISDLADAFLIAILFPAMEWNHKIKIDSKLISKGLTTNLMEFQRAWRKWKPERYSVVEIEAEESEADIPFRNLAISAFTGGVDGAFILHQNAVASSKNSDFQIRASLFVHGFDIPLECEMDFDKSYNDVSKVTDTLDIPLIYMQTNLREFGDWNDTHGAAIIASLTLFNKHYQVGLLGSSHPYDYLRFPWGSNPVTDPLLSSRNFRLYNYGGGYSRIEKLEALTNWPVCHEHLRVCTKYFYKNCGVCEKCVRTKLGYWALNVALPPTFDDASISPFQVLRILAFKEQEIKDYKNVYNRAKRKRKINAISYSLAVSLRINRIIHFLNYSLLRNFTFPPKLIRGLKRFFTS